ncbi:hypothetical protein [Scytonema sp. NUACC26]|uniref:restriction endonuclease-related protein n=1 Tax=Scytonema sp. NUACC26 TaxID=3140176 RepID=UPI0034DB81B2
MAKDSNNFDYLVVGLAEFFRQNHNYPYPDLLQHACNKLALKMTATPYPRTLEGLFSLLGKPLLTWYPLEIPKEFDPDFGLIYDRALSEEASQYLYEQLLERAQLPEFASTIVKQIALENFQFQRLLERLQEVNDEDAKRSQQEYVLLRRFLIENKFTTHEQLSKVFSKTRYISTEEVGELYEDCKPHEPYWCCDYCGALVEKYGKLRGIKPSICNDHRKQLPHVHRISWQPGLRQIERGIHWRVSLPGIPEICLFQKLEKLHQEYPEYLCDVQLWPGIDRYDLKLHFGDESVWGVDIKDYRNPYDLAPKLTQIYSEGNLRHDKSFYVIPNHHLRRREDYIKILREESLHLPESTSLLSDVAFEERVVAQIIQLSQGK